MFNLVCTSYLPKDIDIQNKFDQKFRLEVNLQYLKDNISASLLRNDFSRQSNDECLNYLTNAEDLLSLLVENNDLNVFECLQSEACLLSCQDYQSEVDKFLSKIDAKIDEILMKQNDTVEASTNLSRTKFFSKLLTKVNRSKRQSNECNAFNATKCDNIYLEFIESSTRKLTPKDLANTPDVVFASENDTANIAFLQQSKNVEDFLNQATLAPINWPIYCCLKG